MKPKRSWNRTGRLHGFEAGKRAIMVWRCKFCGLHHEAKKPASCLSCGNVDFLKFDSRGEANHYANLALKERAGLIQNLRAQVKFDLMTIGPNGMPAKFAEYIADFVYIQDGARRVVDFKPSAGIDPTAALKFRCMAAMGIEVTIVNEKGTV